MVIWILSLKEQLLMDAETSMPDSPHAMPKEICCKNWAYLFHYIETRTDLAVSTAGHAAVERVLDGLVENPEYLIQDPDDPSRAYPVREEHLRNPRYWHSNEFSLRLFENASKVIGGYRPLFQPGVIAGYRMIEASQPKWFQVLRLLSPGGILRVLSFINRKFNRTKDPALVSYQKGLSRVHLNYRDEFKGKMTKHVCDWNAGIYMGMGQYTGARNIKVTEVECMCEGGDDCIFEIQWDHLSTPRQLLVFLHSIMDPKYVFESDMDNLLLMDTIVRQEGIISNRTSELKKTQARLIEVEKRALEHRITGGFAHEMRNALAGAQFEFSAMLNYRGEGRSATESATQATIRLFENIETLHHDFGIPDERIAGEIVPHIKDISSVLIELSKTMEGVHQDLERALSITNQIREYARMSEVRPGSEDLFLVKFLKGYESRYGRDFEAHGIAYSVEGTESVVCRGEQVHMDSIFGNLIRNARDALVEKAADHKQIIVRVEERNGGGGKRVVVRVEDNGTGIPDRHVAEIFEPFFSTKPSTGTGLGLAIVRRLVHLYGGGIEVQSRENQGTSFMVTLPKESNG